MKKIVLKFGLISGAIMAALMFVTMPFADKIGLDKGMIVGFTSMILAFLLIFFGVRSYRENVSNGEISFPSRIGCRRPDYAGGHALLCRGLGNRLLQFHA